MKKVSHRKLDGKNQYQILYRGVVVAEVHKTKRGFQGSTINYGILNMNLRERTMKGIKVQMGIFVDKTPRTYWKGIDTIKVVKAQELYWRAGKD